MKSVREWQSWLKISGIISLVIIVVDIVILLLVLDEGILTDIILLPILGIVIGCWVIGFLVNHLKNTNNKWLGNILLIGGSIISGIIVVLTLLEYMGSRGFDFRGWFPLPFSLVIFIFFIISATINVRKSRTNTPFGSNADDSTFQPPTTLR